jgi:hypothetical protein
MLLKTIGGAKTGESYPTMSMIRNGLAGKLGKAIVYFQCDSLWKNLETFPLTELTHDVYDPKRVSIKRRKTRPLFSTGYRQENSGIGVAFGLKPRST